MAHYLDELYDIDELEYGPTYRQRNPFMQPARQNPERNSLLPLPAEEGGSVAPQEQDMGFSDTEALISAMIGRQQGNRADRIRSSMRMPTEAKNLISTGYDLWRAGRADQKGVEKMREALDMQGKAQQEAEAKDMANKAAELKANARMVYEALVDMGYPPPQAQSIADLVASGMLDMKELLPKEAEDSRTNTQKNAEAMGLNPGTPEYAEYVRSATVKGSDKGPNLETVTEIGPDGKKVEYFVDPYTGQKYGEPRVIENPEQPKPVFGPADVAKAKVQQNSIKEAIQTLKVYKEHLEEFGYEPDTFFNATDSGTANAKKTAAMMAMKDAFDLGALQQPDIDVMVGLVPDPNDFSAGKKGPAAVSQAIDLMNRKLDNLGKLYGSQLDDSAPLPRFASRAAFDQAVAAGKLKSGDHFIDSDGIERVVP